MGKSLYKNGQNFHEHAVCYKYQSFSLDYNHSIFLHHVEIVKIRSDEGNSQGRVGGRGPGGGGGAHSTPLGHGNSSWLSLARHL